MTLQELSALIGSFGFPIFLILALLLFIDRRVWPSITKYLDQRSEESKQRHADFINAINHVGTNNDTMSKMLVLIDQKLDEHHDSTMHRLEIIEAAVTNRVPLPTTEQATRKQGGFGQR